MNNLDFSKYEMLQVGVKANKGEPRTQREEIVVEFMNTLNLDRTQEKNLFRYKEWLVKNKLRHSKENINKFAKSKDCYKPLNFPFVSKLLTTYSKDKYDWNILLAQCKQAKSFGACFWSKIKK